jgi:hypothetical protein
VLFIPGATNINIRLVSSINLLMLDLWEIMLSFPSIIRRSSTCLAVNVLIVVVRSVSNFFRGSGSLLLRLRKIRHCC